MYLNLWQQAHNLPVRRAEPPAGRRIFSFSALKKAWTKLRYSTFFYFY